VVLLLIARLVNTHGIRPKESAFVFRPEDLKRIMKILCNIDNGARGHFGEAVGKDRSAPGIADCFVFELVSAASFEDFAA
jgi:hypothetical protein